MIGIQFFLENRFTRQSMSMAIKKTNTKKKKEIIWKFTVTLTDITVVYEQTIALLNVWHLGYIERCKITFIGVIFLCDINIRIVGKHTGAWCRAVSRRRALLGWVLDRACSHTEESPRHLWFNFGRAASMTADGHIVCRYQVAKPLDIMLFRQCSFESLLLVIFNFICSHQ